MSTASRAGGGYGVVLVLGVLGALIFWLTGLTGNTGAEDVAELERLRDGAGVRVTGTMTDVHEREQRSGGRRSRVQTVYCPVYSFTDGDLRSTIIAKACEADRSDLPAMGSTVPVIYDPDGWTRFLDTDDVESALRHSSRSYPWYRWGGLALAVVCGAVLLRALVRGLVRRVRPTRA
ncbi:DUF3592 domain-containing protein [Mumia sp. DW29H23]|uniref:DUF3592 domain-containing protein n=1 Tax=Mumia sp. DW29H23 TaxID=3421241 RepID=UPI003D68C796